MKVVPFFPNADDDLHCLQACVKSVLKYYFPKRNFTDERIDEKTGFSDGWSWLPPTVVWLNELGLKVHLYLPATIFDYEVFSQKGTDYLKEKWKEDRFEREEKAGALKNISIIQKSTKEMVEKGFLKKERLGVKQLTDKLEKSKNLAIGKTVYTWLAGNYTLGNSHFVLVIKKYSTTMWRAHDPGLPPHENRKVPLKINNHSIFGDIVLIEG